jgi:membrane protein
MTDPIELDVADDDVADADDVADDKPDDGEATEGRIAKVRGQVDRARSVAVERGTDLERRFPPLELLHRFYIRYREVNGVVLSGHLAFRAFTFLLPLALVIVTAAGFLRAAGSDPGQTTENLGLGQALASSLRTAGDEVSEAPYHVALVALLGIGLGSLGMLSGFHYVYAQAWQIKDRKLDGKWTKLWRFVLAFTFLFVIVIAAGSLRKSGFVFGVAATVMTGVVIGLAFMGLALIMPRRGSGLADLLPGGVVGAAGVIGLQAFATFYLPSKIESFSATYGALGVAVVFISYLFFLGQIVVASAIASAVWYDWSDPDELSGEEHPEVTAGSSAP